MCVSAVLLVASLASAAGLDQPLLDAVKHGNESIVRARLEMRVDVNATEPDGTTALHHAAYTGDVAIADLLLKNGARVDVANRYGVRPLSLACVSGNAKLIARLLEAGADPNTTQGKGETALMAAARAGSVDGVKALLDRGATINTQESWKGQTALMWAVAEGHTAVAKLLLERGADRTIRSTAGFTAFLFAVRDGQIGTTRLLLDAGTPVGESLPEARRPAGAAAAAANNTPPEPGLNAFLLAVANAHYELAALLLERGADPNAAPKGWTALHQLTWVRKTGIAGSNDPPPQGSGNMDSLTFARLLVKHGANLNARVTKKPPVGVSGLNMTGGTPFLLAARTADAEYMRLLAELGADPLAANAEGTTPLMVAAGIGTAAPGEDPGTEPEVLEAVKVALALGNDINAVDDNGNTAMHGAASKHVPSVVRYLAQSGAKISVWNEYNAEGFRPLDITRGIQRGMNIIRSATTEAAVRELMTAAHVTP